MTTGGYPEHEEGSRPDLGMILAVAGALLFRIAFLLAMPRVVDSADGISYIEMARQFASGRFFEFMPQIPVLYPLLCAAAHTVVSDIEWACRLVSLAASALVAAPVYLLARTLHGRQAARIAALLVGIWPWLADYGCRISADSLGLLLWFTGVWVLYRAMTHRTWLFAWVLPFVYFALHLTRPEGTLLLLAAPFLGLLLTGKHNPGMKRRLLPYVGICAPLLIAHAAVMHKMTGVAVPNYRLRNPGSTVKYILGERGVEFLATISKSLTETLPLMLGPVLLVFLGVGLFAGDKRKRNARLEVLVLAFAALHWALAMASSYPEPRYLMPVIVSLALWAARGVALVSEQARARKHGALLSRLPVALVILVMLAGTVQTVGAEYMGRRPREPREYEAAGLWMKEHLQPGLIICRKPQVGFYADMPTSGPAPNDSISDIIARARDNGARYLVVDERNSVSIIPALAPLLEPAHAPPGLKLLHVIEPGYTGGRVVVYEFPAP